MKKASVLLTFDAEKLLALEQYMAKKDTRLTDELEVHTHRLYEKYVPPILREYIDAKDEKEAQNRSRPSRAQNATINEADS